MEINNSSTFRDELIQLLNKYSKENGSNTPDWILATFMHESLNSFDRATTLREKWYGRISDPCGAWGVDLIVPDGASAVSGVVGSCQLPKGHVGPHQYH